MGSGNGVDRNIVSEATLQYMFFKKIDDILVIQMQDAVDGLGEI